MDSQGRPDMGYVQELHNTINMGHKDTCLST